MCNKNLKFPLKGARLISVIMAVLCCIMTIGTAAFAVSSAQTVELNANGSEARLVMDFPQAAAEEIASMQISLVVSASSDSAEIKFIPDSGLSAKIIESRFHSDTGVLTVYLAGTKALFSKSSPLTVGKIRIGGSSVSASVGVKEGSIKFVRGSELVTPSGDVAYPNSVTISTGGVHVDPPSSASSSSTSSIPSSDQSSSSSASGSSSSTGTSEPDEPAIEPVEPADTSSLADAVERAGGYKRGDYTEGSFATLTEALNKAKAVLSNTGASQDEVDEALLVLENAIGMLTSVNNAPSGTDGYGSSGDNSPSGSDNSSSSGNSSSTGSSSSTSPEKPSDNSGGDSNSSGQTVSGEQSPSDGTHTSDTDTSESSENEKSDNNTVMWILIVMAVLAVAAGVLIAMIKLKKK